MYPTPLLLCSSLAPLQNLSFNWTLLGRSSSVFGLGSIGNFTCICSLFPQSMRWGLARATRAPLLWSIAWQRFEPCPPLFTTALFTHVQTLKFKRLLHNCIFTAVNHDYNHKQRTLKHRNTQEGLKSSNHKSQTWPFELVKVKFCFVRGPLRWLTAAKHTIVSWLLNFRIRLFLKSAVMQWPEWRLGERQKRNRFAKSCWQNNNFVRASRFFVHFFAVTTWLRHENARITHFVENVNTRQQLFFFSWTLIQSFTTNYSRKNWQHLMNWTRWNKPDKVWSMKDIFKVTFS